MIAALYVETNGAYYGLPDVDPWDEQRDAKKYNGPHAVVAHPPCKAWSIMSNCRPEIKKGEDGGSFAAALNSVRRFGGVLEHPVHSQAWKAFGLTRPPKKGWSSSDEHGGRTCEVDQAHYGHRANKRTWLYWVARPPELKWGAAPKTATSVHNDGGGGRDQRSRTPIPFRDLLIEIARAA